MFETAVNTCTCLVSDLLTLLSQYLLSMVHLQDAYYLMIEYSQQATSSTAHKDILRGKKWEKEFLVLIRTGLLPR